MFGVEALIVVIYRNSFYNEVIVVKLSTSTRETKTSAIKMQTNYKQSESRKSLYVFLCSLLGVMLFMMLQKSALLLLTLLLNAQGEQASLIGSDIQVFDTVTYVLALFFGGWYGVWLGLHWYDIVYENGQGGIMRNMFSHVKGMSQLAGNRPARPTSERPSQSVPRHEPRWQFDDLVKSKPLPKPARMDDVEWSTKVSVRPAPRTSAKVVIAEEPEAVGRPKQAMKKSTSSKSKKTTKPKTKTSKKSVVKKPSESEE